MRREKKKEGKGGGGGGEGCLMHEGECSTEKDDSHVLTSVASGLWPPKQRDCNFCRGATLFSSKVEHS